VLPGVLEPASALGLRATGGPANGERLAFRPMVGEPTGPPPDAVLNHRYIAFGALFAIRGFSPMRFDGSGSRGEGLSYFIEFGDGQVSTEPVAIHPIEEGGSYTARLTVVDRFGRADSETRGGILVDSLVDQIVGNDFWQGTGWLSTSCTPQFDTQRGANVGGEMRCPLYGPMQRFSGTLSGERDIRLATDSGEVLTGTVEMGRYLHYNAGKSGAWRMELVRTGGPNSGQTMSFVWRCCYT